MVQPWAVTHANSSFSGEGGGAAAGRDRAPTTRTSKRIKEASMPSAISFYGGEKDEVGKVMEGRKEAHEKK